MKTLYLFILTLSFTLLGNSSKGQTITLYHDASTVGSGFSYNVKLGITEINKGDQIKRYEVKLLELTPDQKGYFYYNKLYSSTSLGADCNKHSSAKVNLRYNYEDNGTKIGPVSSGMLEHVGDTYTIVMTQRQTFKGISGAYVTNEAVRDACLKAIRAL